jgi:hypothetical protein
MLEPGEFVIRRASVQRFGRGFFESLNAGETPEGFKAGGPVWGINPFTKKKERHAPKRWRSIRLDYRYKQLHKGATKLDSLEAAVSTAALTPKFGDDIRAGRSLVAYWRDRLAYARTGRDPRHIRDAADSLKAAQDALADIRDQAKGPEVEPVEAPEVEPGPRPFEIAQTALEAIDLRERAGVLSPEQAHQARLDLIQGALNALPTTGKGARFFESDRLQLMAALREEQGNVGTSTADLAAAMKELTDAIKRQNEFATAVTSVSLGEAWRAMADLISGQIAGYGYAGRAATAGSGAGARY